MVSSLHTNDDLSFVCSADNNVYLTFDDGMFGSMEEAAYHVSSHGEHKEKPTVIQPKALGPAAGELAYKSYFNQQIPVRCGMQGTPAWRPADPCLSRSFVSAKYLAAHHPEAEIVKKSVQANVNVGGIVEGAMTTAPTGCFLKI